MVSLYKENFYKLMSFKLWKIKNLSKFLFLFYLISVNNSFALDKSTSSKTEFYKLEQKNKNDSNNLKSLYILGPGDSLDINFNGIEIYSGIYPINADGYLAIPEIGLFYAADYTIQELKEALYEKYSEFITNPSIDININSYRPITVYISGEVRSPGIYTFKGNKASVPLANEVGLLEIKNEKINSLNIKLYDALKLAKGVNNYADISNIQIIRNNSKSQGGGKIKTNINFLSIITKGDLTQNIRLFDGDYIVIPRSENQIKEQILALNNINLNPDKIKVFVTGNVPTPGEFNLKKGTSLIQAIASTGGKKLMSGNVEFLRFNDDGSTQNYKFRFNKNALVNTKKNPILMDGDVINVRRTILGRTTEILKEVSNPILSGYGLYNIFN